MSERGYSGAEAGATAEAVGIKVRVSLELIREDQGVTRIIIGLRLS